MANKISIVATQDATMAGAIAGCQAQINAAIASVVNVGTSVRVEAGGLRLVYDSTDAPTWCASAFIHFDTV